MPGRDDFDVVNLLGEAVALRLPPSSGAMLVDDLTEPLGRLHDHLIYDADGVGWWGTLGEAPPLRPN